jgi:hypothetical protein
MRNADNILVGKTESERPRGRTSGRLEDNVRMDVREIRWEVVEWMHLAQDRDQWRSVVSTEMNIRVK